MSNVPMHKSQRLINHVALVLDGSGSMDWLANKVVQVADQQIQHLKTLSDKFNQETRVSVYLFDHEVHCLIFDQDVARLPSIKELYRTGGYTALIDALVKSQRDLATTSQIYGDHAFLTYVLTDGEENRSKHKGDVIPQFTTGAKDNWTVGFLVPNQKGKDDLVGHGVPRDCITIWDAQSAKGVEEAGQKIQDATTTFVTGRTQGIRGTKSVFATAQTGTDAVNVQTVKEKLTPMQRKDYKLVDVIAPNGEKVRQDEFVEKQMGLHFVVGKGYYQFTKPELVHGNKPVIVVEKSTGQAYSGPEARALVGLTWGGDFASSSYTGILGNRNLVNGTKFLLLK